MAIKERKDVWKLAAWDPALLWYAKAVAQMRSRPINDPTSWGYQAAMHGYDATYPVWAAFPGAIPKADQKRFWNQCQHATWFFLPWHRMYLAFFEQIVAKTVKDLGGPSDWALPYWNYSDASRPQTRQLPKAFSDTTLPTGGPNPLFEPTREMGAGDAFPPRDIALTALSEASFAADLHGGSSGFGGRATPFNHGSGRHGQLEQLPHDIVHVDLGGLMGDPTTAALDPIFWLHHANIDRLWEVWLRAKASHRNPSNAKWLDLAFPFHSSDGKKTSLTAAQVLDTHTVLSGYTYEGVASAAVIHAATIPPLAAVAPEIPAMPPPSTPPEMIGATDVPLAMGTGTQTLRMSMAQPAGPLHMMAAGAPGAVHAVGNMDTYLNFENVTASGHPGPIDVYLNLPQGSTASGHNDELHAGMLPLFGVAMASVNTDEHPGDGQHYVLKISDLVDKLKLQGGWDPSQLHVTLVPRKPLPAECQLKIGRISLYLQAKD